MQMCFFCTYLCYIYTNSGQTEAYCMYSVHSCDYAKILVDVFNVWKSLNAKQFLSLFSGQSCLKTAEQDPCWYWTVIYAHLNLKFNIENYMWVMYYQIHLALT
jgi:hypothetical protein